MTCKETYETIRKTWRICARSHVTEILCPHGIGHPSKCLTEKWEDWKGVHGCDGCCTLAAFYLAELAHGGDPLAYALATEAYEKTEATESAADEENRRASSDEEVRAT